MKNIEGIIKLKNRVQGQDVDKKYHGSGYQRNIL